MKLIDILPIENSNWFSAIFQIAKTRVISDEKININRNVYIASNYYETEKLLPSHHYKPVML